MKLSFPLIGTILFSLAAAAPVLPDSSNALDSENLQTNVVVILWTSDGRNIGPVPQCGHGWGPTCYSIEDNPSSKLQSREVFWTPSARSTQESRRLNDLNAKNNWSPSARSAKNTWSPIARGPKEA